MKGFILLMLYWLAGEFIVRLFHIPLPGQIVGMGLLLGSLFWGIVKLEDIQKTADFLLKHMMLLFVPVVVGVMVYFPFMLNNWLPITGAIIVGTVGVLATAGGATSIMNRRKRKEQGR